MTIDKAANEVAAGDTVVVGSGVFREQVTMDTAGTSGNQITFIADVDGALGSGDPGLVIISAYDDESSTATRVACIAADATGIFEYTTLRGFVLTGGTTAVIDAAGLGANTYEGVIIEDCVIISGATSAEGILADYNVMTGNVSPGLIIRRCLFTGGGGLQFRHDGSSVASYDAGVVIESCVFSGFVNTASTSAPINWEYSTTNTYPPTMGDVTNCMFIGSYHGIEVDTSAAPASVTVRNCYFSNCNRALYAATDTDPDQIDSDYNIFAVCNTPHTNTAVGANDSVNESDPGLIGGIGDALLTRFWGWSPFRPWEPMRLQDDAYVHAVIGAGDTSVAPGFDLYNETRPMSHAGTHRTVVYADTSDAGPTDNDAAWTNDANAFDGDTGTVASTSAAGTETSNELRGEGTNAPSAGGSFGDISAVHYRVYLGSNTGVLYWKLYSDGEVDSIASGGPNGASDQWTSWFPTNSPSGGWTWADVQALEFIIWATGGAVEIGAVQVRVSHSGVNDDIGAVEGRARPEQETTTVRTGSNSARFEGAGFHDIVLPVTAALTTVDVYAQYDATYTGTLPQLKALNIPGVADQTDTQTGGSGSFEKLTVTFTPTSAGIARIRLQSNDTSAAGECFFDDLAIS